MVHYEVHRFINGEDKVIGTFTVDNDEIQFSCRADEYNCDIFPSGPISAATKRRLKNLLNNKNKSVYIVRV